MELTTEGNKGCVRQHTHTHAHTQITETEKRAILGSNAIQAALHSQDVAEKAVRMNLAQTHAKMASMTSMAVFVSCAEAQAHAGNNFRMAALSNNSESARRAGCFYTSIGHTCAF